MGLYFTLILDGKPAFHTLLELGSIHVQMACQANPARTRLGPTRIVPGLARHADINGPGRARPRAGLRAQARHGDPLNGSCRASSPVGLNVSCRPLAQISVKINYTNSQLHT
jgi:hypothetical protein